MNKRRYLKAVLAGAVAILASAAAAQGDATATYPSKAIRIIVNFPAGGTVDVLARIVAQKLNEKWGQPVIVDNRPGAGGNIGTAAAYTADGDGYTLLASPPGPLSINQNLYSQIAFDPAKFVPITILAGVPNAIAARADFPADSIPALIAYAKANPGKVTYASQGNGSTSHLTGQMFATMTGTDLVHVPYKGEGPALNDLLGGRVDLFMGNISAVLKFREANRIKLLGLASAKRGSMAPDVPTAAEGGLAGFIASAWFALMAPPGTPASIAQKLRAAVLDALNQPDVRQKFIAQGAEVVGGSANETAEFIESERVRWKKVIDTAKVTVD